MTKIAGKTVLITGAAQGIGRLLAECCREHGAQRLVLWDVNQKTLDETVDTLRAQLPSTEGIVVDLADPDQIAHAARTALESGDVDIVINNAGVVAGKPLTEQTAEEIERTMRINTLGVIHTTRAFLPGMLGRGEGHIVNMASASGLMPVPRLTTYGASKWACAGFSESLRVELKPHRNIHVSTICPSYINTGMFAGASPPIAAPLLEPAYVANQVIRAIERNKRMVCLPWIVNFVPILYHALPAPLFDYVFGHLMGIYHSMDHFTGHTQP